MTHPEMLEMLRARSRRNLIDFVQDQDPHYHASPVHHFLAGKLQAVAEGKIRRLIISCPPRHGKSRLAAVELIAWFLGLFPRKNVILASYGAELSIDHSRLAREKLRSPVYQGIFPGTTISKINSSAANWSTLQGGGVIAAGVQGSITGKGAHLLIIDDPIKNPEEAFSPGMRQKIWDFWMGTAQSRLEPNAGVVVIMTRWHVDDLVGRLNDPVMKRAMIEAGIENLIWEVVNLPAIAKDNDPMGRQPGEALDPNRYPLEELRGRRITTDRFTWAALYEGNPVPEGGNYINSTNFNIVNWSDVEREMKSQRWMRYWDTASTEKKHSDYTVGVMGCITGRGANEILWLKDMVRGQWAWPKSREKIRQLGDSEKIPVGMEAVGNDIKAFDNLREVLRSVPVKAYNPGTKDKLTNALGWIAMVEHKRVNLIAGDWNAEFMNECESFPRGPHDDMIDAVSGVHLMCKQSGGPPSAVPMYGRNEIEREVIGREIML